MMAVAANRSLVMSHLHFKEVLPPGKKAFRVDRPPGGLTARISSFADHPEFRVKLPGMADNTPISFSHYLHLHDPSIPMVQGAKLACASCHVPDNSGKLMQPVTFARHCQSCHSVLIDPAFPKEVIPHGNAEAARSFIRRFVDTYSDDAQLREQISALKRRQRTGENLERKIFFGDPTPPAGGSCSLCHVVKAGSAGAVPRIEKPGLPDLWMPRAVFDHSRHTRSNCAACHAADVSRSSADINMPSKHSCTQCHHKTGATDRCTDCHKYHPGQPQTSSWLPTWAAPGDSRPENRLPESPSS
jgi:hypothetical protein